ncbi:MAG TPA: potassium-transporting ATPase subunit KdpA, partial [Planctomycetota bacterium]|nr:potassium-transporting ATPase subunit KdpA [Planctomycetota bacterium]
MTLAGWMEIALFCALVAAITAPLGGYMFAVLELGRAPLGLGRLERGLYRLMGVDETREQSWREYAGALLAFSLVGALLTYAAQRLQGHLPLNPQGLGAVEPTSAFNTAVSFTTNTNWQGYAGESTMSYLVQMTQLAWHNFVSAAAGIGVALALARGLTRRTPGATGVGNFWVDLTRATLYVLLPLSLVAAIVLLACGVPQSFAPYPQAATVEGGTQSIAVGPIASQEAVKELGTNGGGFLNANSAHPLENPTPLSNLIELVLIFAIPAGLTFTYGKMAGDARQGWALFAACALLFLAGVAVCLWAEAHPNPALAGLPVDQGAGNMEGKEVRFGVPASALWAVVT